MPNLYLFYGPEEYLKKRYIDDLEKAMINIGPPEFNRICLYGRTSATAISEVVNTMPVFSENKIVIVYNSGLFKKQAASAETGSEAGWFELLDDIPAYSCLIFNEDEASKESRLMKRVLQKGVVKEAPLAKPYELESWLIKEALKQGKELDRSAAALMVAMCEPGMDSILKELEKLVLFSDETRSIGRREVESICTGTLKSRIYNLTDAIASNNAKKSFETLRSLIDLKEPLQKIVGSLSHHFRILLKIKLFQEEGVKPDEKLIGEKINPYVLEKSIRQARQIPLSKLKQIIGSILEHDLAVKKGKLQDRVSIDMVIAGMLHLLSDHP